MPARLILNADDFGLTPGINRAIIELHRAGVLTSATLMANGPAVDDAVALAHAHPSLGVGCHIVLTDGVPVSPPETVPTLLGPDRRSFRPSLLHFIRDLWLGRISSADIEREAGAQLRKLQCAGIRVTHLDTHKHTHIFPPVAGVLTHIVHAGSAMVLRNPFEPSFASHATQTGLKRRLQIALLNRFQQRFRSIAADSLRTDGTIGISATGSLTATTLRAVLSSLPASGTFEILCHPGYNDADLARVATRLRSHREVEYHALLEEIPHLRKQPDPPQFIHYGDLVATKNTGSPKDTP